MLSRPDGSRLFQNLTRGNWYLIQAEGYLNNSASGQTSEMALTWNRTALPGGSVSVYNLTKQLKRGLLFILCISSLDIIINDPAGYFLELRGAKAPFG